MNATVFELKLARKYLYRTDCAINRSHIVGETENVHSILLNSAFAEIYQSSEGWSCSLLKGSRLTLREYDTYSLRVKGLVTLIYLRFKMEDHLLLLFTFLNTLLTATWKYRSVINTHLIKKKLGNGRNLYYSGKTNKALKLNNFSKTINRYT